MVKLKTNKTLTTKKITKKQQSKLKSRREK